MSHRCRKARRTFVVPLGLAVALLSASCTSPDALADEPSLRLVENHAVEVTGLSSRTLDRIAALPEAERGQLLTVRTEAANRNPRAPAVLGRTHVAGDRLLFEARFPFAAGNTFVARYVPAGDAGPVELEFAIEQSDVPGETRVVALFPSADVWPMNQLKMYVHFSAPMRAGGAFEHIRLFDESGGTEVEQPFVTVQEELWDRERTVLTVLYDPARIKRGLAPHLEAGLPLRAGRSYRLVIDGAWRDGQGDPLAETYTRSFRVAGPDRESPNPADWRVEIPAAGTRDPLVVAFDEPLDHGLLHSLIGVRRARSLSASPDDRRWTEHGDTLPEDEIIGEVEPDNDERAWSFRPATAWEPGSYEIVVPTILEDLAGNTLRGPFDAEVGTAPPPFAGAEAAFYRFAVGSGPPPGR